jgi:hypothetical protein
MIAAAIAVATEATAQLHIEFDFVTTVSASESLCRAMQELKSTHKIQNKGATDTADVQHNTENTDKMQEKEWGKGRRKRSGLLHSHSSVVERSQPQAHTQQPATNKPNCKSKNKQRTVEL